MREASQIYNTVSLLLSEKRTSLSMMRTAIAILTLPTSIFTVLIVTSRYYEVSKQLHFVLPLIVICMALIFFGTYLVFRSFKKIKVIDHRIHEIRKKDEYMRNILKE
jgi:uncharacterized membrane protein YidH (DUF202 family)